MPDHLNAVTLLCTALDQLALPLQSSAGHSALSRPALPRALSDKPMRTEDTPKGFFACAGKAIPVRKSCFYEAGRGVAQPGSALDWGSRGRRFKSGRPDQKSPDTQAFIVPSPKGLIDPEGNEELQNCWFGSDPSRKTPEQVVLFIFASHSDLRNLSLSCQKAGLPKHKSKTWDRFLAEDFAMSAVGSQNVLPYLAIDSGINKPTSLVRSEAHHGWACSDLWASPQQARRRNGLSFPCSISPQRHPEKIRRPTCAGRR
jgi:hypothetical protein